MSCKLADQVLGICPDCALAAELGLACEAACLSWLPSYVLSASGTKLSLLDLRPSAGCATHMHLIRHKV